MDEIIIEDYDPGDVRQVEMHDGSIIQLHNLETDYDPTDRTGALNRLEWARQQNEFITGLVYFDDTRASLSDVSNIGQTPLVARRALGRGTIRLKKLPGQGPRHDGGRRSGIRRDKRQEAPVRLCGPDAQVKQPEAGQWSRFTERVHRLSRYGDALEHGDRIRRRFG
jgi:hypothetical protein